jgi:hypothetical protein
VELLPYTPVGHLLRPHVVWTNFFSFEFIALNFTYPEENQYAYKLEGHDNDWIYCGGQQYARDREDERE